MVSVCKGFVKVLYYIAFCVALVGFSFEAWDISHNVSFTYWLTGALALVTLLKIPHKLCLAIWKGGEWLPIFELLISLVAFSYLTYINIYKQSSSNNGSITVKNTTAVGL